MMMIRRKIVDVIMIILIQTRVVMVMIQMLFTKKKILCKIRTYIRTEKVNRKVPYRMPYKICILLKSHTRTYTISGGNVVGFTWMITV